MACGCLSASSSYSYVESQPTQGSWRLLPQLIHDGTGFNRSSQATSVQKSPQIPRIYLNSWSFFSFASVFAAYFLLQQQTPDTKGNPVVWIFKHKVTFKTRRCPEGTFTAGIRKLSRALWRMLKHLWLRLRTAHSRVHANDSNVNAFSAKPTVSALNGDQQSQ